MPNCATIVFRQIGSDLGRKEAICLNLAWKLWLECSTSNLLWSLRMLRLELLTKLDCVHWHKELIIICVAVVWHHAIWNSETILKKTLDDNWDATPTFLCDPSEFRVHLENIHRKPNNLLRLKYDIPIVFLFLSRRLIALRLLHVSVTQLEPYKWSHASHHI